MYINYLAGVISFARLILNALIIQETITWYETNADNYYVSSFTCDAHPFPFNYPSGLETLASKCSLTVCCRLPSLPKKRYVCQISSIVLFIPVDCQLILVDFSRQIMSKQSSRYWSPPRPFCVWACAVKSGRCKQDPSVHLVVIGKLIPASIRCISAQPDICSWGLRDKYLCVRFANFITWKNVMHRPDPLTC